MANEKYELLLCCPYQIKDEIEQQKYIDKAGDLSKKHNVDK